MNLKSYEEIKQSLADNTTEDITPQDMRDFLDSVASHLAILDDPQAGRTHKQSQQ